jgi:nucleotide-binding universal stress UspA family protein
MTAPATPPIAKRVVVGIDFGETSTAAARWTARHITPGAELVLVHVIDIPDSPSFLRGTHPSREQIIALARTGAEQRLRELVHAFASGLIWTEVRIGRPDAELDRVAREYRAELIVLGRHGAQPGIRDRLGTTAERLLGRSSVPVLVVPTTPRTPPRRILAAVDESEVTPLVLAWTRTLARRLDATATVLYVVPVHLVAGTSTAAATGLVPPSEAPQPNEDDLKDAAMRWLNEQIAPAGPNARLQPAVALGIPASTILAEAAARECDMIVLGSRGQSTVRRLILGSVSSAVLRDANRPVLVVVARESTGDP